MPALKTIPLSNGQVFEVHVDEDPMPPREWDNLGTMVCLHSRYDLGDKHDYKSTNFTGWDALKAQIVKDHDPSVILPLFMFDHSGLTISCDDEKFRMCDPQGWDWGCVGFVFVSKAKVKEAYGVKRLTKKIIETTRLCLLAEVETYDQFLRGDTYGFVLKDNDGKTVDSCWGFYGSDMTENGILDNLPDEYREEVAAAI